MKKEIYSAFYNKPWMIKTSVVLIIIALCSAVYLIWTFWNGGSIYLIELLLHLSLIISFISIGTIRLLQITGESPCLHLDDKGLLYDAAPLHKKTFFQWKGMQSILFSDESGWRTVKVMAYSTKKNKTVFLTIPLNVLINPPEVSNMVKDFWRRYGKGC